MAESRGKGSGARGQEKHRDGQEKPQPATEAHPFQQLNVALRIPSLPSLKLEGYPSGRDRCYRLTLNRTAVLMLLAALPHLLDPKLKPYPAGRMVFTSLTPGAEHANLELRLDEPEPTTPAAPAAPPSAG